MSISIDGYIFNGDIKEFRKKCIKLLPMAKAYKKEFIDRWMKNYNMKNKEVFREYRNQIKFLENEMGLTFDLIVYPIRDKLLVQIFEGQIYKRDFKVKVIEKLGMKFYGYWNNVDRDDCSDEEWEQREEDWTEVLQLDNDDSDSRPCYLGFTISLQNKNAIDY